MNRLRRKSRRDSGLPNQRDTPVNLRTVRRDKNRRFLSGARHEALPEEPEMSSELVLCKPTLHVNIPVFSEVLKNKALLPATPAAHPSVQMPPNSKATEGSKTKVAEEERNVSTPENSMSSSMELDTPSISDSTASTLPSPEILRKDHYGSKLITEEELHLFQLGIKNSTLLDASHAKSIHMYHLPNLSNINASVDENCKFSQHEGPESVNKMHTGVFKSDKAFKQKSTPKLTSRRPILFKKKVSFKSPVSVENREAKRIPPTKSNICNTSGPVQTSSPVEEIKSDADTSRAGELTSKDDTSKLTVRRSGQKESSQMTAVFFDFDDNCERDEFFERMQERCIKLRNAPLFPLSVAKMENGAVTL